MRCSICGWEGVVAIIEYTEAGLRFKSPPLCLLCRIGFREDLLRRGIVHSQVVPCRT